MKKIIFIIPSLEEGGAERVMSILVNHLDANLDVGLVLFTRKGKYLEKIPSRVRIFDLQKRNAWSFPQLVLKLASIVRREKPDTVVSFLEYANIVTLISRFFVMNSRIRWIISERSLPSQALAGQRNGKLKSILHRLLDRKADAIITMSSQTADEMIRHYHVDPKKIEVIPNPVEIDTLRELSQAPIDHPWFNESVPILISIGRLVEDKGYPFLIEALSQLIQKTPARLMILGQGPMKPELEDQIRRLGLTEYVWMPGFISNPYPYLRQATLFILPSLWEGLPNALLEAMSLGKPIIATLCNQSVEQLIRPGENGMLVPPGDVQSLKEAIVCLLRNPELRKDFGRINRDKMSAFDADRIVKEFEELFDSLHLKKEKV
jgi:glycosyltransferase involved in cell wall biosynthesis